MKACVLHAAGDLRVETVETPRPGPGRVLLRVAACGVCGSDIPRVFEKGTYRFPLIPGHEFAGVVEELGEGVNPAWLGKTAAVFPLIPCRNCPMCLIGAYAQCADYDYLGSRSDGAFAGHVTVPEWNLVPVPEGLSPLEAAMCEPAAVAAHALRRAAPDPGGTVMIFGAGPIGLMLAQWAAAWGAARVLLADIDPEKLRFAREQGFTGTCNPLEADPAEWARTLTGGGADVVIEGSGSGAAFAQAVKCARPFGSVVLMGNPAGAMTLPQQAYSTVLRNELRLLGTWNSVYAAPPRDEWRMALDAMASGRLRALPLVSHRVPLEGLPEALEMMRDRRGFFNKVMLVNE